MAEIGRIAHDRYRGWHLDFRSVQWPGAERARRITIKQAPLFGRFATRDEAQRCLTTIRERCMVRPLHAVLAEYLDSPPAEQCVPHKWVHDFLASKQSLMERGRLSRDRWYKLSRYPARGVLAFWADCPVNRITGPAVQKWSEWLMKNHPELGDVSLRHLLTDFRTFCGHMRRLGELEIVPEFPRIRVARKGRVVPDRASLTRVLEQIPERERGLFLARAHAGLRPAEARRLNAGDYRDGALRIRAEIAKTAEERVLPIAGVAPELDAWIRAHRLGAKPWEPLFPAPRAKDKRWKGTPERRVWCAALAAAGLAHVAPNLGGRHAFGTHEAASRTDIYALRDFMGHASVRTTEAYIHTAAVELALRMRPAGAIPAQRRNSDS